MRRSRAGRGRGGEGREGAGVSSWARRSEARVLEIELGVQDHRALSCMHESIATPTKNENALLDSRSTFLSCCDVAQGWGWSWLVHSCTVKCASYCSIPVACPRCASPVVPPASSADLLADELHTGAQREPGALVNWYRHRLTLHKAPFSLLAIVHARPAGGHLVVRIRQSRRPS